MAQKDARLFLTWCSKGPIALGNSSPLKPYPKQINTRLLLNSSYICPEPVLAKRAILCVAKNGSNKARKCVLFFLRTAKAGRAATAVIPIAFDRRRGLPLPTAAHALHTTTLDVRPPACRIKTRLAFNVSYIYMSVPSLSW